MKDLTGYAWLSIAASLVTILLKAVAYLLTGSVGLLSDALESLVNLAAAVVALIALRIAARPADESHSYGHTKAEYFASGTEGALILLAAVSIGWAAFHRLLNPRPLEDVGDGLAVSVAASIVNLIVARVLMKAGRRHHSITLEADAKHLMTDVWTSVGVIVGVAAVALTGWLRLDPIIAIAVAINIVWSGVSLMWRSTHGLMDAAIPEPDREKLDAILVRYRDAHAIDFHAVRTRLAGSRRFVSMHVLVPGAWSVKRSHDIVESLEEEIRREIPPVLVFTHLEPIEDPIAYGDEERTVD
jgi:cation diffusion facilitator family transporter